MDEVEEAKETLDFPLKSGIQEAVVQSQTGNHKPLSYLGKEAGLWGMTAILPSMTWACSGNTAVTLLGRMPAWMRLIAAPVVRVVQTPKPLLKPWK